MSNMFAAFSAMSQGNYSKALQDFQEILTNNPEDADAHVYMSICLSRLGRRYGALEEVERALNLNPELALAHAVHAIALHNLDDQSGASKAIDKALSLDPFDTTALEFKCSIALAQKRLAELKDSAEKLIEKEPASDSPKYYLSRFHALSGNAKKAESYAREALAIDAQASSNHEALGWAFVRQKKYDDAQKAALNSLKIDPMNQSAHLLYVYIKLLKNPITGIVHRLGLFMRFLSEKKIMIYMCMTVLLMLMAVEVARFAEMPELKYGIMGAFLFVMITLQLSNTYVARVLQRELASVELKPDY